MTLAQMKQALQEALKWIRRQQAMKAMKEPTQNALKIYQKAKDLMGVDASPADLAPDSLGCAETVWNIIYKATATKVGGAPIVSTRVLYEMLLKSPSFESVTLDEADAGDIIISPTGYAPNKTAHGHCGIVAKYGILSNNSETGTLEENWTKSSWKNYYGGRGFPVCVFRML